MKRGLKDDAVELCPLRALGYNHCPDEKGTESSLRVLDDLLDLLLQPLPR